MVDFLSTIGVTTFEGPVPGLVGPMRPSRSLRLDGAQRVYYIIVPGIASCRFYTQANGRLCNQRIQDAVLIAICMPFLSILLAVPFFLQAALYHRSPTNATPKTGASRAGEVFTGQMRQP
jgi:hypothetical protein